MFLIRMYEVALSRSSSSPARTHVQSPYRVPEGATLGTRRLSSSKIPVVEQ